MATKPIEVVLALKGATAVQQGMQKVQGSVTGLASTLTRSLLPALSVAGLAAFVKTSIEAADAQGKFAERTGLATQSVAGLQLAARQYGIGVDTLEGRMHRLTREIAKGNSAFDVMGVATRNADGSLRNVRSVLGDVADKFATYEDGAEKSALAMSIMGRTGAAMIPLLNAGSEAIAEMDGLAARLGLTVSQETAAAASEFTGTLDLMGESARGAGLQMAEQLLPALNSIAGEMLSVSEDTEILTELTDGLSVALRGLYVVFATGKHVVTAAGRAIGGAAAAFMQLVKGDWAGAKAIMDDMHADNVAGWEATAESIARVWNQVHNDQVAALAAMTVSAKGAAPQIAKPVKDAVKSVRDEFAALMDKLQGQDLGLSPSFHKDLATLQQGLVEGRIGADAYAEAVGLLIKQQKFAQDLARTQAQALKDLADAREREMAAARQGVTTLADHNARLREDLATLGMTRAELVQYERTQISATIARRQDTLAAIEAFDPHNERIDLLREEIALLQERSGLLGTTELRRQELELADSWARTVQQMGDQFTDALIQGGASVKEALKRMFQNLVLRPIIAPIMGGLAGMLPGGAMAGQGGGGGLGGIMNLLNGSSLTGSTTAFISDLGSRIGGDLGAKLMMNSQFLGSIAGGVGNAFIGYGLSKGLSGGYSAGGWVNAAAGVASAIPGIGPIAGLVGAAVNRLFGRKFKDAGIYGSFTGDGFAGGSYEYMKGGLFRSSKTNENPFDAEVSRLLGAQWSAITGSVRGFADALGLESERIDNFAHDFKISMGKVRGEDFAAAFDDAWAEALRTGSNELAQQLIGTLEQMTEEVTRWARDWSVSEWGEYAQVTETVEAMTYVASEFARDGEEAIDTLTRLGTSIIGANQVLELLNQTAFEASLAGGDMASQLVDLFGGLDNLAAASANYYDKFFTDAEKHRRVLQGVQGVFAELNQELPLTHAGFRDVVEALDLTTDAGREAFAALMGVADAFDALMPDLSNVASDMTGLLTEGLLGTFEGDNIGAAMAEMVTGGIYNAIAGHFAQQISNIIVQGVVEPIVAAAMTGASVSAAVSQATIDQMVAQARAVAEVAGQVMAELQASGVMDAIGAGVGSLGPSFRVAAPRVETYARAVNGSGKAANDAAREAERLAQAWQRLTDSLLDEVQRIRGVVADASGQSLAYWQSQFAVATAQARAGDQAAAAELVGLSRSLLTAAELEASSLLDLQRLRAATAQSLSDTAAYTGSYAGGAKPAAGTPGSAVIAPIVPPQLPPSGPVVVQADPQTAAEVRQLRQIIETQGEAMRQMQHELVRYARRWDVDGLPVVEVQP